MKTVSDFGKLLMIISFFSLIVSACDESNKPGSEAEQLFKDSIEVNIKESETVKLIYSLPSPIETAMILKKAGAVYCEDFLNNIMNADKYTSNKAMALNLGVFCADLSYASLNEQNQTSIKYMNVSKKLADKLGIINAIDQSLLKRLENNVNNKDSIVRIISESFYNTNSYLNDNNRTQIANMILAGGWIEGIYLSSQLVRSTNENTEITNRMIEQKLSLDNLIDMLKHDRKNQGEDMLSLIAELEDLQKMLDKIQIKSSEIETVVNAKNKTTTLASKNEIKYNKDDFEKVMIKVEKLRAGIVI